MNCSTFSSPPPAAVSGTDTIIIPAMNEKVEQLRGTVAEVLTVK
jgi:hypothetical protein